MVSALRESAATLREIAENLRNAEVTKVAHTKVARQEQVDLDPNKVLAFLTFFGGGSNE